MPVTNQGRTRREATAGPDGRIQYSSVVYQVSSADMSLRYEEWPPERPDLRGLVTAIWRVAGDPAGVPSPAVLPDGHVELVLNLGAPVRLAGPAFRGPQPRRVVVGPLHMALGMTYRGPVATLGVRFHPARGAGYFGRSGTALVDRLTPLASLAPELDAALRRWAAAVSDPAAPAARAALEAALAARLPAAAPADRSIVAIVDRLADADEAPTVAALAAAARVTPRQLLRRFSAAVGMTPKRFVRVVRFARTWQIATMSPPATWAALAAEHGYADQAHLIREFRAFGAEPPTRVFPADWYDATELVRATGPAAHVRNVQSRPRSRKL
jgi:AraC-like DNA-binding protein